MFVCKLGPIEFDNSAGTVLLPIEEDGTVLPPVIVPRVADGLRQLAARGGVLECEKSLAASGRKFGFKPTAMPRWALEPRCALALHLAWGPAMQPSQHAPPAVAFELAAEGLAFSKAEPWRYFGNEFPIRLDIGGQAFEAAVMGAGGSEFGLAIYPGGEGALERFLTAADGDPRQALRTRTLAVTLNEDPFWAAEAVRGLLESTEALVPFPMATGDAAPGIPDTKGLVTLVAALRAVAQLSPRKREVRETVSLGGFTLEAHASI